MWAAIAALCLLFVSCGILNPQQQASSLAVIEDMYRQGAISIEQYESLKQLVLNSQGTGDMWQDALRFAYTVGGSLLGIRLVRGPATQKVGLPESKIIPSAPQPA